MSDNSTIRGLDALNIFFTDFKSNCLDACKEEIEDIALDFASKSSNAAPIDKGDLRGDLATPKKVKETKKKVQWKVGSGLPYTRRQHECLWYNHPRGGGAKFLEYPFKENEDRYNKQMNKRIKEEINSVTP